MKKNIQRIMSIMLILFLLIPFLVMADTNIDIDYTQNNNNAIVNIKGAQNRPISITIKDDFRYHYMNQGFTDDLGEIVFEATLETDKTYDCKVNIDGNIATKNIVMEKNILDPGSDPEKPTDKTADLYIKGYKGVILNEKNIKIKNRETALDFTTRILDDHGISYENRKGYMASIDGQKELDKGKDSGWMFSVNGKYPDVGAGSVLLKDGDSIRWLYTYDLGGDIGAPVKEGEDGSLISETINEALEKIKDEKASEKVIGDVIDSIVKCFAYETAGLQASEIKELLDNGTKVSQILLIALEKAETENLIIKIADSSIVISKSLNNTIDSKTDKTAVEKIGQIVRENMGIFLDSINRIKNKSKVDSLIDDMIETSAKIEDQLFQSRSQSNKDRESTIGIKILEEEGNSIKITLLQALLEKAIKKDIDRIKTISSLANFDIAPDFLDKNIKEDINISITKEIDGLNIEFRLGNKILNQFSKSIKISLPYDENIRDKNKVTAILLKEDGTKEVIGGVYDELTKTVKFLTNKPGKFTLEERIKEFKDTEKHQWAEEAIESMAVKGIINGKTDEVFDPSAKITRAEFAALISRMLKYDETSNHEIPFKDVNNNKWYYNSIISVYENGLINGKTATIFDPEGNITREEMAKIVGNILKNNFYKKHDKKELDKFIDNGSIASWAEEGAAMAAYNGIINGIDGEFKPKTNGTRAETAVMLYRLYGFVMD